MDVVFFAPILLVGYSGLHHKWASFCPGFFISYPSGIQSEAVLFSHIRGWGGSLQGILSALPFPLPLFSIQIGLKGAKLADQPSQSACTDLFNTSDGTDLKLLWKWRSTIDWVQMKEVRKTEQGPLQRTSSSSWLVFMAPVWTKSDARKTSSQRCQRVSRRCRLVGARSEGNLIREMGLSATWRSY